MQRHFFKKSKFLKKEDMFDASLQDYISSKKIRAFDDSNI